MERLSDTAIDIINELHTERLNYNSEYLPLIDAANRLAHYEDTGKNPEEIERMKDLLEGGIHKPDDDWVRVQELLKAEQEGRLVVLPCKPSDVTVYQLRNKKHAKGVGISPRHISCATVWSDGTYALEHQGADACTSSDFGKTWFLTETEAEAALAASGKEG